MKKILMCLMSLMLIISGGVISAVSFADDAPVEEVVISVSSVEEFLTTFSSDATYNDKNIKIELNSDLDFKNEKSLSSIHQTRKIFSGIFDGNGHTISNLTLTSGSLYYGLIPYANGATIRNLKISGNVSFEFDENNIQEVYAGIILGYGENVIIENCELYNIVNTFEEDEEENEVQKNTFAIVNMPVYSNISFGGLAGKIKGNPRASVTSTDKVDANIVDCAVYYDVDVNVKRQATVYVGGLVGQLEQGYILNSMSFGNIGVTNSVTNIGKLSINQYFGGVVGYALGRDGAKVKNACFAGDVVLKNDASALSVLRGAIVGGLSSTNTPLVSNINFDYWTSDLPGVGMTFAQSNDKFTKIDSIRRDFLMDSTNFDNSNPAWDFETTWLLVDSELRLQKFQTFNYSFKRDLDVAQILDNAYFTTDQEDSESDTCSASYGTTLYINLTLKPNYFGYYSLSGILLNSESVIYQNGFSSYAILDENNRIVGYKIPLVVNDTTDGDYSFTMSDITYNCVVTISDTAKKNDQGGVRTADASSPTSELTLSFAYNTPTMRIVAVGNESKSYSFDYWGLYYVSSNGVLQQVEFDGSRDSSLTIKFGNAPFNKEFRLVAYFTNERAIRVSFTSISDTTIKSIKIGGQAYIGEEIRISPNNNRLSIEIVTQKNYILNYTSFINSLKERFGENVIMMTSDPLTNEEGETTYNFRFDMRHVQGIDDNQLAMALSVTQDNTSSGNDLLWLYITLPIVAVVIIGVVVFIIIRRRGGGGKGRGKNTTSADTKKQDSYSDYYI